MNKKTPHLFTVKIIGASSRRDAYRTLLRMAANRAPDAVEFHCNVEPPSRSHRLIGVVPELLGHLVAILEPMERSEQLSLPGLVTLNKARSFIKEAKETK